MLTVKQFLLKKFPTSEYMDCPIGKHHWETMQEYAEAYHAQFSSSQPFGIKYMEGLLMWVRDNHIQFTDGEWYHTDDKDGDHPMSESDLVEQYVKLNPTSSQPCEGREVWIEIPVSEKLPEGNEKCWVVCIDGYCDHHYKDYVRRHPEKFKSWLSRTTLPVANEKENYWKGFEYACEILESLGYDRQSNHPYLLSDCVRAKCNKIIGEVRKNPHYVPLPPIAEEKDNYVTRIFDSTQYYWCKCEGCGWEDSSEFCEGGHAIADSGDYSDPVCPICFSNNIEGEPVLNVPDNEGTVTVKIPLELYIAPYKKITKQLLDAENNRHWDNMAASLMPAEEKVSEGEAVTKESENKQ